MTSPEPIDESAPQGIAAVPAGHSLAPEPHPWSKTWQMTHVIGVYVAALIALVGVGVTWKVKQSIQELRLDSAEYFFLSEGEPKPIPKFGGFVVVNFVPVGEEVVVRLTIYFKGEQIVIGKPVSELKESGSSKARLMHVLPKSLYRLEVQGVDEQRKLVILRVVEEPSGGGGSGGE